MISHIVDKISISQFIGWPYIQEIYSFRDTFQTRSIYRLNIGIISGQLHVIFDYNVLKRNTRWFRAHWGF